MFLLVNAGPQFAANSMICKMILLTITIRVITSTSYVTLTNIVAPADVVIALLTNVVIYVASKLNQTKHLVKLCRHCTTFLDVISNTIEDL